MTPVVQSASFARWVISTALPSFFTRSRICFCLAVTLGRIFGIFSRGRLSTKVTFRVPALSRTPAGTTACSTCPHPHK